MPVIAVGGGHGMQRLLRATWLIVVSSTATSPTAAQEASRPEIVAPAPLTRPLEVAATRAAVRIGPHSYEGSGTRVYPSLWVVNGTPLGLRPDGSVDRDRAGRELGKIRCRDVVSIDILRGDAARKRYGPNVPDGVVLLVTKPPAVTDGASDEP